MFGRVGNGTNIKKKASKTCSKTDAKNDAKSCIQKSIFFWLGFWNPLETSGGSVGGASGERRRSVGGASGVTLSQADHPGRRHIIKEYCRIINKDGAVVPDLTRLEP